MNERTAQAERLGMVTIDDLNRTATILAPRNHEALTDTDWLLLLRAASEVRADLERDGYTVTG